MEKKYLTTGQILNMSVGFLGIQFGFALQNANVSRIFETLGAKIEQIPILWIAAPLTGLVVQPVIGYLSDRTWTRLGRRRPYFLAGAIMASLALVAMPNATALWMAAVLLWIMDLSINVSMEPFRAFVADNLRDEQRTKGFLAQSFFIGLGAVIGSLLPWALEHLFHVPNTAPPGHIPPTVKIAFYTGAVVFLAAILWTVFTTTEYPPEELAANKQNTPEPEPAEQKQFYTAALVLGALGVAIVGSNSTYWQDWGIYLLGTGLVVAAILFYAGGLLRNLRPGNALVNIASDMLRMPRTMRQLAWVQFFTWFGLFAMWIYTTATVTRHIYLTTDTSSAAYNEGANWVGVLFTVYNGIAALVAVVGLPQLARLTGRKRTHAFSLTLGALGLMAFLVIRDPKALLIPMVGVGIAWASILSMPYAMLARVLPAHKMGYYMGVFNFFIVIPQLIAATVLGLTVKKLFHGDPLYALVLGGISMLLAALLTLKVDDNAR